MLIFLGPGKSMYLGESTLFKETATVSFNGRSVCSKAIYRAGVKCAFASFLRLPKENNNVARISRDEVQKSWTYEFY